MTSNPTVCDRAEQGRRAGHGAVPHNWAKAGHGPSDGIEEEAGNRAVPWGKTGMGM